MYHIVYSVLQYSQYITIEKEVKEKIKGLRSQYGREKKKEKKRKTGDGADDIYKSSWVHFSRLKFLDDFVSTESSRSNLEVSNS